MPSARIVSLIAALNSVLGTQNSALFFRFNSGLSASHLQTTRQPQSPKFPCKVNAKPAKKLQNVLPNGNPLCAEIDYTVL